MFDEFVNKLIVKLIDFDLINILIKTIISIFRAKDEDTIIALIHIQDNALKFEVRNIELE